MLMPRIQSGESSEWKERTDSHTLSSVPLYMYHDTLSCVYMHVHTINTSLKVSYLENLKKKSIVLSEQRGKLITGEKKHNFLHGIKDMVPAVR